jgi:putative acetyltransferase
MNVTIRRDDLLGPEIAEFLEEHIRDMRSVSPPESKHALDLEGLRRPDITFWTAWSEGRLIGCGALKDSGARCAEIKSMRTARECRSRGVGSILLRHIENDARQRGYRRLSLETGSMPYFGPARALYLKHGFEYCPPFPPYKDDPNSVFMTKVLVRSGQDAFDERDCGPAPAPE